MSNGADKASRLGCQVFGTIFLILLVGWSCDLTRTYVTNPFSGIVGLISGVFALVCLTKYRGRIYGPRESSFNECKEEDFEIPVDLGNSQWPPAPK